MSDRVDSLRLREAVEADIPAMVALLGALFAQEAEFSPDPGRQAHGLKLILSDPGLGRLFVAETDGRVQGMVSLLFTVSTALGARVAWLEDMIVAPEVRGTGLGARLLDHALGFAKAHGLVRVTLLTDASNGRAQRFYQQAGFSPSPMIPLRRTIARDTP